MGRRKYRRKLRIRWKRRLTLTGLIILMVFIVIRLIACHTAGSTASASPTATADPVYKNSYDWSYLSDVNGVFSYQDDTYESLTGMDVSYAQGDIDWRQAAADGIDFVIIRAGYRGYESGELHEDAYFQQNIEGALASGLKVGAYFSSQAITVAEAEEEARFTIGLIASYRITCPVAFDMEQSTDHDRILALSEKEKTAVAAAFCRVIRQAGYTPIIYGSEYWLNKMIAMEDLQDTCEFWLASYTSSQPAFPYVFSIWQYTNKGIVDGVDRSVDLNLWLRKKQAGQSPG